MKHALYCSMLYRNKKVKKYQEGYIELKDNKVVLYDEQKVRIDSVFTKRELEEGLELDMDRHYCVIGEDVGKVSVQTTPVVRTTRTVIPRKRLQVTLNREQFERQRNGERAAVTREDSSNSVMICARSTNPVVAPRQRLGDLNQRHNKKDGEELSHNELLSLFGDPSESTCDDTSIQPSQPKLLIHQKKSIVEISKKASRFAAYVENSSSSEGEAEYSVHGNKQPSLIHEKEASRRDIPFEEEVVKPKAKINNTFKPVPLKPLPSAFRSASTINKDDANTDRTTSHMNKNATKQTQEKRQSSQKPYTKPKKPRLQQYQNIYGLIFNPEEESWRLYRKHRIPTTFQTLDAYRLCWRAAIVEVINLEIADIASKFGKLLKRAPKTSMESFMRSNRISFYENVCLRSMDNNTQFGSNFERLENVSLDIQNKEHHSAYSKDDIWAISTAATFEQPQFFTSYFYGPSNGTLELVPLAKHHEYRKWYGNNRLFAIRLNNAGSELMMLYMLEQSLAQPPIVPHLLGSPKTFQEKSLVVDIPGFEQMVCECILEYRLNEGQRKAIDTFCKSIIGNQQPVVLVHGVYGAGKSYLLSVLIITLYRAMEAKFLEQSTKLVFASLTNVAVDRILQSLLDMDFDDFVRVGSIRKIAKRILPFTCHKSEANSIKELETILQTETLTPEEENYVKKSIKNNENQTMLSDAFLIGITTLATNFGIVQGIEAPIAILDECSQMTEPMSLLPMTVFKSSFSMCVGDPKQLPPTLSHTMDSKDGHGIETTLFERLANAGHHPILLNTQYRCHPDISAISSQLFYGNKLITGVSVEKRSPLLLGLKPVTFLSVYGQETKVGGSYSNTREAKIIITLIKKMMERGVDPNQVGVISLYKGQISTITEHLKQSGISVLCATVDSFQGAEMDVIIVSTVRTARSEFLEDPKRINVALTRAKRHLVMLASDQMVQASQLWSTIKEACRGNVTDPHHLFQSLKEFE